MSLSIGLGGKDIEHFIQDMSMGQHWNFLSVVKLHAAICMDYFIIFFEVLCTFINKPTS